MAYGIRCRDASGNITLDTTTIACRLRGIYTYPANATTQTFVASDVTSNNSFWVLSADPSLVFDVVDYGETDYGTCPRIFLDNSGYLHVEKIDEKNSFSVIISVFSYI